MRETPPLVMTSSISAEDIAAHIQEGRETEAGEGWDESISSEDDSIQNGGSASGEEHLVIPW